MININVKEKKNINLFHSDCLVIPFFKNGISKQLMKNIPDCILKSIKSILNNYFWSPKFGDSWIFPNKNKHLKTYNILLINYEREVIEVNDYSLIFGILRKKISNYFFKDIKIIFDHINVKNLDLKKKIKQGIISLNSSFYEFNPNNERKINFSFFIDKIDSKISLLTKNSIYISEGINLSKKISDTPSNICTPHYLSNLSQSLFINDNQFKIKILEKKEMKALKMNALLSVSKGSKELPKLIVIKYFGSDKTKKPIVIIGKGITFDSGGLCLKNSLNMSSMKYDMCGGASIIAIMNILKKIRPNLNIIGIVPSSENMPDGKSIKPQSVVETHSGKTVEIINTDAEGRLILCDAISFCKKYNPREIIDIATLTGGVILSLGHEAAALFTNSKKLKKNLINSSKNTGDRIWNFPLWKEYQNLIKSPYADIKNVSNTYEASTIIGACFLQNFIGKYRWAHLDIAGVATKNSKKGVFSTGKPTNLIIDYLLSQQFKYE